MTIVCGRRARSTSRSLCCVEIAALTISILAIIVSAASAGYSRQQARSGAALATIETERREEEVARAFANEEQRKCANVDVRLDALEANSSAKLIVSNQGPHPASEVSLSFVRALSAGPVDGALTEIAQRKFDLRAGESQSVRISPSNDTAQRYEIAVRWTDGAGGHDLVREINHL